MKKRILAGILTGAFIIGSLVGCGSKSVEKIDDEKTPAAGEEGALKVVRFGSPNSGGKLLFELLEVAHEDGSLEEELNAVGYTGEYHTIDAAGPGINEAFASGDLDVAVYGDFPASTAKSNGIDTTVIGVSNSDQAQAIFVREGSGIESIKDLEGKKVAVGLGTNYQYFWENFLEGTEVDGDKVEIVNSFDFSTLLSTGDVDAAAMGVVSAVYFESQGLGHILIDSSEHSDWTTEFLVVAKTDYINENPEVGVAVNKALIRARQKVENDAAVLAEATSNENIPADIIKKANELVGIDGYNPENFITATPEKLQKVIDLMYKDQLIGTQIDAAGWIDTKYYEQAKSELQ